MLWNFKEIKTTRTQEEQVKKIEEEIAEYRESLSDKECIDILHAAETLVRIHFKNRDDKLRDVIEKTRIKNEKRGYYVKNVF